MLGRQPKKPNTKTIFRGTKNRYDWKDTHGNRYEDDFREPKGRYEPLKDNPWDQTRGELNSFPRKDPKRKTEKPMKSNTKTTLRNKGTTQITGRWPMKSNTKRILRDTKKRYEREKHPWQKTEDFHELKGSSRTMGREPTKPNTRRIFENRHKCEDNLWKHNHEDRKRFSKIKETHYEPWEGNPWNQTRQRFLEKDDPREQTRRGLSRTIGSLSIMRRQPMKLKTKTIFRETKKWYKWKDNLTPMKTNTKTTVEHQRDVRNHGKITHETNGKSIFRGTRYR